MASVDRFIVACYDNKVREVRRMISEGVDINGLDSIHGVTGLMVSMMCGNKDVVRILLGCNSMKMDSKTSAGRTALHWACLYNQVESVQLFLTDDTCTKDIVRMESNAGNTAEKMANKWGNHGCARLIREFLENNNDTDGDRNEETKPAIDVRSINELVEFISGQTEKKKRGKKRKNMVQAVQTEVDVINNYAKAVKRNTELVDFYKVKLDLEEEIAEKRGQFLAHQQKTGVVAHIKSDELVYIVMNIEKTQNEKITKVEKVEEIDKQLIELETKIKDLKQKKICLVRESKADDIRIQKFECEKQKLEEDIGKDLKIKEEEENVIKNEIVDLEEKLEETKMSIKNLSNDASENIIIQLPVEPNKDFLEFIEHEISEKEKELECPVCLDVAACPILMCSEQHLICGICRPKLSQCPQCREMYTGKDRRHRYAEKTREELDRLRQKKGQVIKYSG